MECNSKYLCIFRIFAAKVQQKMHIRKHLGKKTTFFSAILPNNGLTTDTNKAGGLDRPPAYRPLLTPLQRGGIK